MCISNHFLGATLASPNDGRQALVLSGLMPNNKKSPKKTHHTAPRKPHEDLMQAGCIFLTITTLMSNISPNLHFSPHPRHAPTHCRGCGRVMRRCREGWERDCSAAGEPAQASRRPLALRRALGCSPRRCCSEEPAGAGERPVRFQTRLDRALSTLIQLAVSLLAAGGLD